MNAPFDMQKYTDDKLACDMNRFIELYVKYKDVVEEILEFADLCKRFYPIKKNKYED